MNVGDVIQRAIVEYYNNPGTKNDSLTPVMVAHWIDKSIKRYWRKFQDNNFGYFAAREQVLNVTSASNIYPMPNGNSSQTLFTFNDVPVSGSINFYVNSINSQNENIEFSITYNTTAASLQSLLNSAYSLNTKITGGPAGSPMTINWGYPVTVFYEDPISNSLVDINGNILIVTPVTSNLNVAIVTAMAIRTGSAPNYQYTPLGTFFPNQKYGPPSVWGSGLWALLSNGAGNVLQWCYEAGSPDPFTQLPTASIRFSPWPSQSNTIVYDCVRYPNPILYDNSSPTPQPITTQVLDLPLHFHDGVVMDVLIEAYTRMKADTTELVQLLERFDKDACNVESKSLQRQGPEMIQITDGNGYGGY